MPGSVGENVKLATTCEEVADTAIALEAVDDCPVSLVTVSVTVNVPAREYWCVTVTPEPILPSPKSQVKVPPIAVEDEALKDTSSLRPGAAGEDVKRATVGTETGKSAALNVTY